MSKQQFKLSFLCLRLAVESKLESHDPTVSIMDLAVAFGKSLNVTRDDLEEASEAFNWDYICQIIEGN